MALELILALFRTTMYTSRDAANQCYPRRPRWDGDFSNPESNKSSEPTTGIFDNRT